MPQTLSNCPVCSASDFTKFINCKDYTVSQERFQIVQCKSCGFKFTNPRPSEEEISAYYQSEEYISHSNKRKGLLAQVYQRVRKRALRQKAQLIAPYKQTGNLLDYGCGTGEFLHTCQQQTWQIDGIEPDAGARAQAQALTQTDIQESLFLPYFQDKKYDVITLWHVLEHVHQLDKTLEKFRTMLQPNGRLVLALPNAAAWDAERFGEYWAAYDVPRHLYHFEPKTLAKLADRLGFELCERKPMFYDAYYISLLSGKYQKGYFNFPLAFWQGWQSNRQAAKQAGQYSSLIYILKIKA